MSSVHARDPRMIASELRRLANEVEAGERLRIKLEPNGDGGQSLTWYPVEELNGKETP